MPSDRNPHTPPPPWRYPARFLLTFTLLAGLLSACLQERDRSAEIAVLIEQNVEERLERYRRVRLERCREDLIEEATRLTDSILIAEARLEKSRSNRPIPPPRPVRPETRRLDDSIAIKPLLPVDDTLALPIDTSQEKQ